LVEHSKFLSSTVKASTKLKHVKNLWPIFTTAKV